VGVLTQALLPGGRKKKRIIVSDPCETALFASRFKLGRFGMNKSFPHGSRDSGKEEKERGKRMTTGVQNGEATKYYYTCKVTFASL
jgi:hypothetical protein